jgi:hypothetical protein
MKTLQKALILAGFYQLFTVSVYAGPPTTKLSVEFVGMTNNPTPQRKPIRLAVNGDAKGLCALFFVTNNSTTQAIWFDTVSIEQKTAAGWKPFVPSGSWTEVGTIQWEPRYGCLLAVAWPPGLATNATWRLQMSYGQNTSTFGPLEDGMNIQQFYPGKKVSEGTIPSSEVHQ